MTVSVATAAQEYLPTVTIQPPLPVESGAVPPALPAAVPPPPTSELPSDNLKSWAEEDRPREKMLARGRRSLTDSEIVAVLLRSGTTTRNVITVARDLLSRVDGQIGELARLSVAELCKVPGIGPVKAVTLQAALELGRRHAAEQPEQRIKLTVSSEAFRYLRGFMTDLRHEEFHILCLNTAGELLKSVCISRGGITGTVADARLIFRAALDVAGCTAIILAHNHPSGRRYPSQIDFYLTERLAKAGKLIELPVLDHLIITDTAYYSFADEGFFKDREKKGEAVEGVKT
ncbi:MAG: DNA repair protein RadC [Saprospiraceae bacterium]